MLHHFLIRLRQNWLKLHSFISFEVDLKKDNSNGSIQTCLYEKKIRALSKLTYSREKSIFMFLNEQLKPKKFQQTSNEIYSN